MRLGRDSNKVAANRQATEAHEGKEFPYLLSSRKWLFDFNRSREKSRTVQTSTRVAIFFKISWPICNKASEDRRSKKEAVRFS